MGMERKLKVVLEVEIGKGLEEVMEMGGDLGEQG